LDYFTGAKLGLISKFIDNITAMANNFLIRIVILAISANLLTLLLLLNNLLDLHLLLNVYFTTPKVVISGSCHLILLLNCVSLTVHFIN